VIKFAKWTAAVGMFLVSGAAWAHHSAAAEYWGDVKSWTGTITRFAWVNPHSWVYFDVSFDSNGANGKVAHWECEGSAPGGLMRNGWTRDTLRPGMRVTIEGYPAKDRPHGCKIKAIRLPDGRRLTMG